MNWAKDEWKSSLSAVAAQNVEKLEKAVEALKKEKSQRQYQLETLEAALNTQKRKTDEEKVESGRLKREIQDLCGKLDDLERDRQKFVHDLQTKEALINCLNGKVKQGSGGVDSEVTELQQKLEDASNLLIQKENELQNLKNTAAWNGNSGTATDLLMFDDESSMKMPPHTNPGLVSNLLDSSLTLPSDGLPHYDKKPNIKQSEREVNDLENKVLTKESEIHDLQQKLKDSLSKCDTLRKELDSSNKREEKVEAENVMLKSQVEKESMKYEDLQRKLQQYASELECQRHNAEAAKNMQDERMKEKERQFRDELSQQRETLMEMDKHLEKTKQNCLHEVQKAKAETADINVKHERLAHQILQMTEKFKDSQENTSHLKQNCQSLEKANNELNLQLKALNQQKDAILNEVENHYHKTRKLEEEIASKNNELHGQESFIRDLKRDLADMTKEMEQIKKGAQIDVNKLQAENDRAKRQYAEQESEKAQLTEKAQLNEAIVKEQKEKIAGFERDMKKLQHSVSELQTDLDKERRQGADWKEKVAQANDTIKLKDDKYKESLDMVKELEGKLAQNDQKLLESVREHQKLEHTCKDLQTKIDNFNLDLRAKQDEMNQMKKNHEEEIIRVRKDIQNELGRKLTDSENQRKQIESKIKEKEQELVKCRKDLDVSEREKSDARDKIYGLEKTVSETKEEVNVLKREAAHASQVFENRIKKISDEASSERKSLQKEISEQCRVLEDREHKNTELSKQVDMKTQENRTLDNQLVSIKHLLDSTVKERDKLAADEKQANDNLHIANKSLEDMNSKVEKLNSSLAAKENQFQQMQARFDQEVKQLKSDYQKACDLADDKANECTQLSNKLQDSTKMIDDVKQRLDLSESSLGRLSEEKKTLEGDLQNILRTFESQKKTLEEQIRIISADKDEAINKGNATEDMLNKTRETVNRLEAMVTAKEKELKDVISTLQNNQRLIEDLEKKQEELHHREQKQLDKMSKLEDQVKESVSEVSQAQKELSTLQEQLSDKDSMLQRNLQETEKLKDDLSNLENAKVALLEQNENFRKDVLNQENNFKNQIASLENSLQENEKSLTTKENTILDLRGKLEVVNREKESLISEKKDNDHALNELQKRCDRLQEDNRNHLDRLQSLTLEGEEKERLLVAKSKELEQVVEVVNQLKQNESKLCCEVESLKNQVNEYGDKVHHLESKCQSLLEVNEESQKQFSLLESSMQEKEQEYSLAAHQLTKVLTEEQQKCKTLECDQDKLKDTLRQKETEISNIETELSSVKAENSQLVVSLDIAVDEQSTLREDLEEQMKKCDDLEQIHKKTVMVLEEANQTLKEKEACLERLTQRNEEESHRLENEINTLKSRILTAENLNSKQEGSIKEFERENKLLSSERDDVRNKCDDIQTKLKLSQEEMKGCLHEKEVFLNEVTDLRQTINARDNDIASLQSEICELSKTCSSYEADVQNLQGDKEDLVERLCSLNSMLEERNQDIKTLENKLVTDSKLFEHQVENLGQEKESLLKEVHDLREKSTKLEGCLFEMEAEARRREVTINELSTNIESLEKNSSEVVSENDSLKRDVVTINTELENRCTEQKKLDLLLTDLMADNQDKENTLLDYSNKYTECLEMLSKVEVELARLESDNKTLKDKERELLEEREKLLSEKEGLEEDINTSQRRCNLMTVEMQELKESRDQLYMTKKESEETYSLAIKEANTRADEMFLKFTETTSALNDIEADANGLRLQVESLKEANSTLQERIEAAETDYKGIKLEKDAATKTLSELEKKLVEQSASWNNTHLSLKEELQCVNVFLEQVKSENAQLQSKLTTALEDVRQSNSQRELAEAMLLSSECKFKNSEEELIKTRMDFTTCKNKLISVTETLESHIAEKEHLIEERAELTATMESLTDTLHQLENDCADNQIRVEELESNILKSDAQLKEKQDCIVALNEAVACKETLALEMCVKLENVKALMDLRDEEITKLQTYLTEKDNVCKTVQEASYEIEKREAWIDLLGEKEHENDQAIFNMQMALDEKGSDIEKLECDLMTSMFEKDNVLAAKESLVMNFEVLKETNDELKTEKHNLLEKNGSLHTALEALEGKLNSVTALVEERETRLLQAEKLVGEQERQLESINNELIISIADNERLETQLKKVVDQLANQLTTVQTFRTEYSNVRLLVNEMTSLYTGQFSELQEYCATIQRCLSELHADMATKVSQNEDLRQQSKDALEKLEVTMCEMQKLSGQNTELKLQNDGRQQEISLLKSHVEALEEKLSTEGTCTNELKDSLVKMTIDFEALTEELRLNKGEMEEALKSNSGLQQALRDKTDELVGSEECLHSEIQRRKEESEMHATETKELEQKLAEGVNKIGNLKSELENLESEKETIARHNTDLRDEIAKLHELVSNAGKESQLLRQHLDEERLEMQGLQNRLVKERKCVALEREDFEVREAELRNQVDSLKDMEQLLKEKVSLVDSLTKEIEEMRTIVVTKSGLLSSSEERKNELEIEVENVKNERDSLLNTLKERDNNKDEVINLQTEVNELAESITSLENEKKCLYDSVEVLNSKLALKELEINEQESSRKKLEAEKEHCEEKLSGKIRELEEEIVTKDTTSYQLLDENKSIKAAMETNMKEKLDIKSQCDELQDYIMSLEDKISGLFNQNNSLQNELDGTKQSKDAEIVALREKLDKELVLVQGLKSNQGEIREEVSQLEDEKKKLLESLSHTNAKFAALEYSANEMSSQLKKVQDMKDRSEQEISENNTELAEKSERIESLTKVNSELEKNVADLKSETESLKLAQSRVENDKNELQYQFETVQMNLKEAEQALEEQQGAAQLLTETKSELCRVKNNLVEKESELADAMSSIQKFEVKLSTSIQESKREISELQEKLKKQEEQRRESLINFESMKTEREFLLEDKITLTEQVEKSMLHSNNYESVKKELNEKITLLNTENQELMDKLDEVQNKLKNEKESIKQRDVIIEGKRKAIVNLQSHLDETEAELEEVNRQVNTLKDEVKQKDQKNDDLRRQNQTLEVEKESTKEDIKAEFEEERLRIIESSKQFVLAQLEESSRKVEALENELLYRPNNDLEAEIEQLKFSLEKERKMNEDLVQAAEENENKYKEEKERFHADGILSHKMKELEQKLRKEEKTSLNYQTKLLEVEKKFKTSTEEVSRLEKKIVDLHRKNSVKNNDLKWEKKVKELETALAEKDVTAGEVQKKVKLLEKSKNRLEADKTKLLREKAEAQEKLKAEEGEIKKLTKEYKDLKTDFAGMVDDVERARLKEKEEILQLKDVHEQTKTELSLKISGLQRAKNDLAKTEKTVAELRLELDTERERLRNEIDAKEAKISEAGTEMERLKKQYSALDDELSTRKRQIVDLEDQIKEFERKELSRVQTDLTPRKIGNAKVVIPTLETENVRLRSYKSSGKRNGVDESKGDSGKRCRSSKTAVEDIVTSGSQSTVSPLARKLLSMNIEQKYKMEKNSPQSLDGNDETQDSEKEKKKTLTRSTRRNQGGRENNAGKRVTRSSARTAGHPSQRTKMRNLEDFDRVGQESEDPENCTMQ